MIRFLIACLLSQLPLLVQAQIISTYAGNGCGYTGDGGPAISANLRYPAGGAFDSEGNFYFVERTGHRVRKISSTGVISTFVGTGSAGFSGDGGLADTAKLNQPGWVCVDVSDNVYIADINNNRIRKVDNQGIITTVAGNGSNSHSGDNSQAISAGIPVPMCIDHLSDGSLLILESGTRIRKVSPSGIISTIVGDGVANFSGDGGQASIASIHAQTILVDSVDNIYIADLFNYRVRKVEHSTSIITTVAGTGQPAYGGDGGLATLADVKPFSLAFDDGGRLFVADGNQAVRMIDVTGIINTIAGTGVQGYSGDGGVADLAQLYNPQGVNIDTCNNLFITEAGSCHIRKVTFNDTCGLLSTKAQHELSKDIDIYPNPAQTKISISASAEVAEVFITNTVGQVVCRKDGKGNGKMELDISDLQPGIYFVTVEDKQGVKVTKKVVKE